MRAMEKINLDEGEREWHAGLYGVIREGFTDDISAESWGKWKNESFGCLDEWSMQKEQQVQRSPGESMLGGSEEQLGAQVRACLVDPKSN